MAAKKTSKKKAPKRKKAGRPDGFSWAVAEKVLTGMADGKSLTAVCKKLKKPTRQTVAAWVTKGATGVDPELQIFAECFIRCSRIRTAMLEDDYVELISRIRKATSKDLLDGAALRFKLELDALKWYLGKFRSTAKLEGVDEALARLNEGDEDGEGGSLGGPHFTMKVFKNK